ncbi:MAG: hypothetical protein IOD12_10215 [Silvanigrellales bacterium]|nr:hypothetical protein [Silvanigrellales bacterium]
MELKSFFNENFFTTYYLNEALIPFSKGRGLSGDLWKELRRQGKEACLCLQEHPNNELRKELAEKTFQALGFYEHAGEAGSSFSFKEGPHRLAIAVERKISLMGNGGELWLFVHLPENGKETEGDDFPAWQAQAELQGDPFPLAWEKVLDSVFNGDESPAEWAIVNCGNALVLSSRGNWQEGKRYLKLSLHSLWSLASEEEYVAAEALFAASSFPLSSAESLIADVEAESHKKAAEVTLALRDRVREAIEIVATELLRSHKVSPCPSLVPLAEQKGAGAKETFANVVFDAALRFVYRLLFLFYSESKEPETTGLPVHSRAYQLGLALERLRDLENVPFQDKSGSFLYTTLQRTCLLYFKGDDLGAASTSGAPSQTGTLNFSFPAVGTDLFNPEKCRLLQEAKVTDGAMQTVLRLLSLAQTGRSKQKRTHRVHYAALGINQLGAVYEGLLSLKPFVLQEKVALLKKEDGEVANRFVPWSKLSQVEEDALATDDNGNVCVRHAGEFLLAPVGLERKFSASFYTPEVLTRSLAREAVAQACQGFSKLEQYMSLRICEPAMGSGAFLGAVADALAERMAPLWRKQEIEARKQAVQGRELTLKETPSEKEAQSWAKQHLLAHCVYGVDLNPTAVELAKVSLWLGGLGKGAVLPFLDQKLKNGNSLVGAWVKRDRDQALGVASFLLLPAAALDSHLDGNFLKDKTDPFLDAREKATLKDLQKQWQTSSTHKPTHKLQQELTAQVDALFASHLDSLKKLRTRLKEEKNPEAKRLVFEKYTQDNSAFYCLRGMMDLWCSLWFWPHKEWAHLPSPHEFLQAQAWLAKHPLPQDAEKKNRLLEQCPQAPLLRIALGVAAKQRFFHWDLEYADVFEEGGFDLVIGNPPWAPVRWEDEDFFKEANPGLVLSGLDSNQKQKLYAKALHDEPHLNASYKDAACRVAGFVGFLKDSGAYEHDGSNTNTYKYFYQRFRQVLKEHGILGMIAQDGLLTDDKNMVQREQMLVELNFFHKYQNEKMLFAEVGHGVKFSVWTQTKGKAKPDFEYVSNLYHPETVERSRKESPLAPYRGMKDEEGKFETRGHPHRILRITEKELRALSKFDSAIASPLRTSLPSIHGKAEFEVLAKLAEHGAKLEGSFCYWRRFDESFAPRDGLITLSPGFHGPEHACLKGPNIFVGNPSYQNINKTAKHNQDYAPVDLTSVPDDFFPMTAFKITAKGLKSAEYISEVPWKEGITALQPREHNQRFRIFSRTMVNVTGERTLATALLPPGSAHINRANSLSFKSLTELTYNQALFNSILYDFFSRVPGSRSGRRARPDVA